jgi:hypothetical protein
MLAAGFFGSPGFKKNHWIRKNCVIVFAQSILVAWRFHERFYDINYFITSDLITTYIILYL